MLGPRPSKRGTRRIARALAPRSGEAGLTLIELIVAFSLMLILSLMALPVARVKVQREKERRLRDALHEMRQAIDRHKDMADDGELGDLDPDNFGYPASLEALVNGVEVEAQSQSGGLPTDLQGSGFGQAVDESQRRNLGQAGGFGSQPSPSAFGSGTRSPFQREDPLRRGDPLARDEESPESVRFLRSIPLDPMTGQRRWGLLSVSDDPRSRSWNGQNVFDVYSLSNALSLDGTRYAEW